MYGAWDTYMKKRCVYEKEIRMWKRDTCMKKRYVYADSNICMEHEIRMWKRDTYMKKEIRIWKKRYVYGKKEIRTWKKKRYVYEKRQNKQGTRMYNATYLCAKGPTHVTETQKKKLVFFLRVCR